MTLRVVVVTRNSADVVSECLDALGEALRGVDAAVVVVDVASSDGTADVVGAGPGGTTVVQRVGDLSRAAATNLAVADANPNDDVLLLSPDVRLAPDCVHRLLAAADAARTDPSGHRVGILAPRLVGPDGADLPSRRREPTLTRVLGEAALGVRSRRLGPMWSEVVDEPAHSGPTEVDWASGAVLLVRAACRRGVGPWDESYRHGEETDYCLRARDLAWTTRFVPGAVAVHRGGRSLAEPDRHALRVSNRLRLVRHRRGGLVAGAFRLVLLVGALARVVTGRRTSVTTLRVLLGIPRPRVPGPPVAPTGTRTAVSPPSGGRPS